AAATGAAQRIQADARGDLPQPGARTRIGPIARPSAPGAGERLLDEVLCLMDRSGESVAVEQQIPSQGLADRPERGLVKLERGSGLDHAHSFSQGCRQ